jgi:hypothetical protein
MKTFKLLAAIALLAALPAAAQTPRLETVHEVEASSFIFPSTETGTVTVQGCRTCPSYNFQADEKSVFQIGNLRVSLAQLRAEFSSRPEAVVLFILNDDRRSIQRIAITDETPTGQ